MITENNEQLKIELRDKNGLTLRNTELLRKSVISAKNSTETFKSGTSLLDTLKD